MKHIAKFGKNQVGQMQSAMTVHHLVQNPVTETANKSWRSNPGMTNMFKSQDERNKPNHHTNAEHQRNMGAF